MRWHADLHVHSKHSRATSRDLDLEHLAYWAGRKGIAVVATGDFTHPAWFAELKDKLVQAEAGLFRLRDDVERWVTQRQPAACRSAVRFMLSVEISTIYKKGERTRKVHHLLYAPDFETAERVRRRLARIGNIASDGRPILGLDSRDLLEITLESGPGAYLVPAHIWTPWFAALGSQSGFDSIIECYGELADHIFAVETGLSSDPPMNWRLSQLDRYRLVSHSDAHSPAKLGREATVFECDVDYFAIRRALETGAGYVGTVEFFPEEGKYHLDGHRKCGVRLMPGETLANAGRCPACGQPVTVGVLHRVETLADRSEATAAPPPSAGTVRNLVPLQEVLSEILGTGPSTKTVGRAFDGLLARLGPELSILQSVPVDDIARADVPLLDEAVTRLRADRVICNAGYDGEYGVIRLFDEVELQRFKRGGLLAGAEPPAAMRPPDRRARAAPGRERRESTASPEPCSPHPSPLPEGAGADAFADERPADVPALRRDPSARAEPIRGHTDPPRSPSPSGGGPGWGRLSGAAWLDDDQRAAVEAVDGPVLIVAGPGSGKTRVLTHRIAHLVADHGAPAAACLAITFTRRAAAEMRDRLATLLPESAGRVPIHTFHSLGLAILREHSDAAGLRAGFRIASDAERVAVLSAQLGVSESKAIVLLRDISAGKRAPRRAIDADSRQRNDTDVGGSDPSARRGRAGTGGSGAAVIAYRNAMRSRDWIDFDDLVVLAVEALAAHPELAALYRQRFRWISVDEFQDVDAVQYRLLVLLAPPVSPSLPLFAGRTSPPHRSPLPPPGGEGTRPARANICVIGDPNQSIYGFRGADASCFDRFRADYPDAAVVRLARNYRSAGTIVTAAAQMIAASAAADPAAQAVREMHDRIAIHTAPTDRAEAELVVQEIERLIGGHSFFSIDTGRATGAADALGFADFAVLYRADAQAPALEEALARSGIPFRRHSHAPLAEQPEIRALLRALGTEDEANEAGDACRDDERLEARLRAAAERLEHRDDAPSADALRGAVQRLTTLAHVCTRDGAHFVDAVATATEADLWDPRADRVSLLTLHAAKGLEFRIVFIIGVEDGVLPLHWAERDDARIAEERRLFYVGMTRAQDRLILSHARQRLWRRRIQPFEPSPFLMDIQHRLLERRDAPLTPRPSGDDQLALF